MNDVNKLKDEIGYLRHLAESGRNGPILGGIFLAAAGLVFGIACVLSWAGYQDLLPIRGYGQLYLWLGAFGVFAVVWLILFFQKRGSGAVPAGASSATFGTIWGACGMGVMIAFLTVEIVTWRLHAPVIQAGFVPIIFAFYGTAWIASSALAKRKWMMLAGAGSFLFSFIMALLSGTTAQPLVMGAGLILLLTLPGFKLTADAARP